MQRDPRHSLLIHDSITQVGAAKNDAGSNTAQVELYHSVCNDLRTMYNLAELELRRCKNPASRAGLERLARHALALATLYELMQSTAAASIDFTEYLSELCERLAQTIELDPFEIVVEVGPLHVETGKALLLAISANELVAEAAQHAFPRGFSVVTVRLWRPWPAKIALSVSGYGRGFVRPRPRAKSLAIVHELVRAAGGELLGDGGGTTRTIQFAS